MSELLKGEVYDFYISDKNKNISLTDISEKILFELGLNIKSENEIAELVNGPSLFASASNVVKNRLYRLTKIIQKRKKGFPFEDSSRNEVFFDLREYPELTRIDDSSSENFSQSSNTSRVSNLSDLEIEIPSRPRIKRSFPFTEVGPKAKSIRTKEICDFLLETANKENISPERLAAYLGYKVSCLKNKKVAQTFKDIFDEKEEETKVELSQALYIREHCQIGRGIYTDLRLALKNKAILPPHNLLSNLEKELLPDLEMFEHGWKVNLSEAVTKTIERWFSKHDHLQKETLAIENGIHCYFS